MAATRRVYCRTGVAAFARDPESSQQVWSAREGYPGDRHYRDFYRDIGFDLPLDYIGPYIHPEGHRTYTGIKYHAITHEQLHDKWVYDPAIARQRAGGARRAFPDGAAAAGRAPRGQHGSSPDRRQSLRCGALRPLVVRGADIPRRSLPPAPLRPADCRGDHARATTSTGTRPTRSRPPSMSSWGWKGYAGYWLDESNAWVYRHLHTAGERMVELARRHPRPRGSSSGPSTRPRAS